MFEIVKKYKILTIIVLMIIIAIPLVASRFKPQPNQVNQPVSSDTSAPTIKVSFTPLTSSVKIGEKLDVDIIVDAGQQNISAVDITISYGSNLLGMAAFSPSPAFTPITLDTDTPGTIHYVGVNPTANVITGASVNIGKLSFSAKKTGTAAVKFINIHINASGVQGALNITGNEDGLYTITN